jgi:hypothetical protein
MNSKVKRHKEVFIMKDTARTYKWTILLGLLLMMAIIIGSKSIAIADVAVGDVIDKTNWQKVQGLLPEAMVEYVKKGYFTINVGKLNYDPSDILNDEYKETLKENAGKYFQNKNGYIQDKKTGEIDPMSLHGIPFPPSEIDVKDPSAPYQMIDDHSSILVARSNLASTATLYFVGKKLERSIAGPQATVNFICRAKDIAQQPIGAKKFGKGVKALLIMRVTEPYELNGFATMVQGFNETRPDKVFAYIPALRRARVLTAGSKSDAMFGTDYASDDASGFMGKTCDFTCKYIRTQDTLVRYMVPDVIGMVKNKDGSYDLKRPYQNTIWGFQVPGWQGKPWAPTNGIWVKRNVHVIQCMAKDPYYNYGKFELWYDPLTYNYAHKIIWDRAGKRWKMMIMGLGAYRSADGYMGQVDGGFGNIVYDEQRDHATCIDEKNDKERMTLNTPVKYDDFTMGGLVKFSK